MAIIKYKDWEFIVDKELTKKTYDKIEFGSSDICECIHCKNFAFNKEDNFPTEIKNLLNDLGIDFKKECEAWHYYKDDLGRHCYSGWFHFKGKFKGKSLSAPTKETSTSYDLTPITDNFSLGFLYDDSLTYFENNENLVQVEFDTKINWRIDETESE